MIVRGIGHLQHLAYCAAPLVTLGLVVALLIPGSSGAKRVNSYAMADTFSSAVSGASLQVSPDPVSLGSLAPGQQATGQTGRSLFAIRDIAQSSSNESRPVVSVSMSDHCR